MKLIRDKIPRDLPKRRYGTVTGEAVLDLLVTKLHEEADEVKTALDIGGDVLTEELADVIEVCVEISERRGVPEAVLMAERTRKFHARGAFREGHVIV